MWLGTRGGQFTTAHRALARAPHSSARSIEIGVLRELPCFTATELFVKEVEGPLDDAKQLC